MATVKKYDEKGGQSGEYVLDDAVFAAPIKKQAVHEALIMQLSNRRRARAKCKNRALVAGGSAKPFRQKGTGRARAGTSRSPLKRGGGVIFGPDGRANYRIRLPRKVRRAALKSLLTDAAVSGRLAVINDVEYQEPKTRQAAELISNLECSGRKLVFVTNQRQEAFEKSVRNIPGAKVLVWSNLNPHDLLYSERIILFEGAVEKVVEVLR